MQEVPKSKYLEFFRENSARLKEQCEVIGDVLIVERIQFPEMRTASGLYVVESARQMGAISADKPYFYRVLLPGAGYFDDSSDSKGDIPLNTQQGDIVLMGQISVKLFSSFPLLESYVPDSIGLARESDVTWRFKGEAAFAGFLGDFNRAVKGQVEAASR